jgi:hypothetical protein
MLSLCGMARRRFGLELYSGEKLMGLKYVIGMSDAPLPSLVVTQLQQ